MALAGSWSVVGGAHIRAFTFLLTKTLSRSRSVVWCVHVACVVCGLCVYMWCGEAWHSLSLALSPSSSLSLSLSLSFSLIFIFLCSFSFSFSLAPSLALVLSLFLLSLSPLLATKHYGKNRSTNTAANIEAFECDLTQGKCTAVGSLPPPLPSLLPSLPPLLKKKKGTFYYRNISGEEFIFFITILN